MRSQANRGKALEELIIIRNQLYERDGIAVIHKVPTEWLPLRDRTGKIYSAKVERKAAVDFLGNYQGRPIAFDAKHTMDKRIQWSRLEPHQWEFLLKWERCGGLAFVLVGWDMKQFFVIPIQDWGREGKSLLLTEAQLISARGGLPDYLAAVSV
jgi:recombination protein U